MASAAAQSRALEGELQSGERTPTLPSPPRSGTPPTITGKRARNHAVPESDRKTRSSDSKSISAHALSKALQRVDQDVTRRASTPSASPSRKRQKVFGGDGRFIPNRSGQDLQASYSLMNDEGSPASPHKNNKMTTTTDVDSQRRDANRQYSSLLRSEMFDSEVPQSIPQIREGGSSRSRTPPPGTGGTTVQHLPPTTPHKNLFSYGSGHISLTPRSTSRSDRGPNINARSELYSLSPVKHTTQTALLSPRKTPRQVSKVPYKVLDAPELADDFYLNLVDWGPSDVLAVGLGNSVYLWSRETGLVNQLCQLDGDSVTSVSWIQRGTHLAIGTNKGLLVIYDTIEQRRLRTMTGHSARVSSLAWNAHILSSGSRDRSILHRDVRMPAPFLRKLTGHKQEVCGLKWNSDTEQLASGGNDNKIFVWDRMEERWLHRWGEQEGGHKAAVKAIAWSPHQRGLLASGGGTADRCIKFWNTISSAQNAANATLYDAPNSSTISTNLGGRDSTNFMSGLTSSPRSENASSNPYLLRSHDTGSQVCNLLFSHLTSEIVSTHGYSQHAINIWRYPSMSPVATLTGHTYRVLYLSMSPDGGVIVTGAGDETLRFWDVFGRKEKTTSPRSIVNEWGVIR